ncbi:MAG TPA: TlpA disulfide reductase family protein [Microbacteriaceae bacterium]|nr:TlpA disulfide reductase family protein [Microbacteriaceae bacterium]
MAGSTVVLAPELEVSEWVGTPTPLSSLRGRVVMIEAFQILCPGCIAYGLPQARKVQRMFPDVTVVGLNTVFEHHEVTGPDALRVFLAEYGYTFPVAFDRPGEGPLPLTMQRYGLQGTPSTVLIDKSGTARFSHLGAIDDLALGMMLGRLVAEESPETVP